MQEARRRLAYVEKEYTAHIELTAKNWRDLQSGHVLEFTRPAEEDDTQAVLVVVTAEEKLRKEVGMCTCERCKKEFAFYPGENVYVKHSNRTGKIVWYCPDCKPHKDAYKFPSY